MVSIPVKLYAATANKDISFHQRHNVCDTRIHYQKFCPNCERTVGLDEIQKGYEFARGQDANVLLSQVAANNNCPRHSDYGSHAIAERNSVHLVWV
jgi:hypothetical protein